jgi:hypothetical protein
MALKVVFNNFSRISKQIDREVSKVVADTTDSVAASMKLRITTGSKTGRIYKKSKTGKSHQASAPGEAPASDTGNLVNSIEARIENKTTGVVDIGAEYAAPLEFGTEDKRIARRPFVTPSVEEHRESFEKDLKAAIDKGSR